MALITLTTDFGIADFTIGAMKGQLYSVFPEVTIVDFNHQLHNQNYLEANYICQQITKHYPPLTIHFILFDVFAQQQPKFIITTHQNQFIVAADNGLLPTLYPESTYYSLPVNENTHILNITKALFLAISSINFKKPLAEQLSVAMQVKKIQLPQPSIGNDWITAQIILIDQYENVVLNVTKEAFEEYRKGRNYKIVFVKDETINTISHHYGSVEESQKVAFFNSGGYLEVAVNKGNMVGLFGLQKYKDTKDSGPLAQYRIQYESVRIFFH